MSPNTKATWDPTCLRLDQGGVARSRDGTRRGRRISHIQGKYIAGPLDFAWLSAARELGVTVLWVGLGLWFLRGLRHSDSFIVSNLMMREWGVEPDAKSRALRALENAGLITVERRGKRSPIATLVIGNIAAGPKFGTARLR
jgi:hypothetical protein